jgi:Fic family protein
MGWNWQLEDWREFCYQAEFVEKFEQEFVDLSGQALGALRHIEKDGRAQLRVEIIRDEALQTSEIEGEFLDRDSLQSSLRQKFGLQVDVENKLLKEKGISELLFSVFESYDEPLSHELFQRWHRALFQKQREDAGYYRQHIAAMQVVSGAIHNPIVHFEAPPSSQVIEELDALILWYNEQHEKKATPPVAIAAITHLWFESIHPFEDGNGRVGRALAEKSLSQSLKRPALISLSTAIQRKKSDYYAAFSKAQSGKDNEITSWMQYFLPLVIEAQQLSIKTIDFIIKKGQLLQTHQKSFNERQNKVILRVLEEGVSGFKGGLSASNYRSITQAPTTTATRDLNDLVAKGVLKRTGERKGTRYWLNF